ncbi:MAG TPA: hypothetical protein VIM11_26110, partial [Tepidisphaeraceae bacterium]
MYHLKPFLLMNLLSLGLAGNVVASEPPVIVDGSVLVLPFSTPQGSLDAWIGKAMRQDLEADLMRGTHARLLSPSDVQAASDSAEALALARSAGASIVVFGQAQSNNTEVRLTGQVLDVTTARPFGSLKATGNKADLFHLEDAIAGQTLALLPRQLLNEQAINSLSQPASSSPPAAASPPASPQTNIID